MVYRICKQFEVENGHMLSKHPERCRFPHGHSRRIEVVLEARELDANDMVLDFKALKLAVGEFIDRYDHAVCINADDPLYPELERLYAVQGRLIPYAGTDPTSEVMARELFEYIRGRVEQGGTIVNAEGMPYRFPPTVKLRRLRVWETSTSWAEVEAD